MLHDVNFSELTSPPEAMTREEMEMCIDNLREHLGEANAHWSKVASILQADPDDAIAVVAAARTAMAGIGGDASTSAIQIARDAFPAFNDVYRKLDEAMLFEFDRFNKHCDDLAAMSIEEFIRFKQNSMDSIVADSLKNRRWWCNEQKSRTFGQRIGDAIAKWSRYGTQK